jgi:predicted aldo/keto reductase-like oxidoreductase
VNIAANDWYEKNVEETVRDVVRLLRDNGVNTVGSCHHDMTVQCEHVVDGQLKDIHDLLYNYLLGCGEPVTYTVTARHTVENGYVTSSSVEIRLARPARPREGVGT